MYSDGRGGHSIDQLAAGNGYCLQNRFDGKVLIFFFDSRVGAVGLKELLKMGFRSAYGRTVDEIIRFNWSPIRIYLKIQLTAAQGHGHIPGAGAHGEAPADRAVHRGKEQRGEFTIFDETADAFEVTDLLRLSVVPIKIERVGNRHGIKLPINRIL